jgi:dTDP-4-amino-4,6-dideoxygalactose transaminase
MSDGSSDDGRPIPFVDLVGQHGEIRDDVIDDVLRLMEETSFVGGPEVAAFEAEFAEFCGAAACVGVANGTDAIEVVLRAIGIGPGDEVVVPTNSFIATAEAVLRSGALPVFVDCDPDCLLVDPHSVERVVSPATRAVIGVDLYGQRAPFDRLGEVVGPDVVLVEDAAQSQGATRHGGGIGSHVVAAATSFYPGKNLGAYGDAGGIVTDDEDLAARARAIANHGGLRRYEHLFSGVNSRLDALQAAVLRRKLRRLDDWNAARRDAAGRYDELVADLPVRRVGTARGNDHVHHLYVIEVAETARDRVLAEFARAGVGAGIHYPTPIHLTPAFIGFGGEQGDHPVAEAASRRIVSLPMHPHLGIDDQRRVVEVLAGALGVTHRRRSVRPPAQRPARPRPARPVTDSEVRP